MNWLYSKEKAYLLSNKREPESYSWQRKTGDYQTWLYLEVKVGSLGLIERE